MKAIIDAEKCIGCGLCAEVAPDVYEMEGELAITKTSDIAEDKAEEAKNGAEQCPVEAIVVE